jgi:hypothetical protein
MGILFGLGAVLFVTWLLVSDFSIGALVVFGLIGLFVYRFVRNRRRRMLKVFVAKVRKMKEVQVIAIRGNRITIVADRAPARLFLRVNGLVETVNGKLFFGEPIEAAVCDDLTDEALAQMLREPGVAYVREDVADRQVGC